MSTIARRTRCPVCQSTQDTIRNGAKCCAGCLGKPCSGSEPEQQRLRCHCGGTLRPTGRDAEFQCLTCKNFFELSPDIALVDDRPERCAQKKEEFEQRKRDMRRKQAARF